MGVGELLGSFLGGSIGVALVAFFGRDWFAVRLHATLERRAEVERASFAIKRDACLEALSVVDAANSQLRWLTDDGETLDVAKQPLVIAAARRAYNQLSLTCSNPDVIEQYAKTLGLRAPNEPPASTPSDTIVDLRNAMRKELGFGTTLNFDRSKAWIATLEGGV